MRCNKYVSSLMVSPTSYSFSASRRSAHLFWPNELWLPEDPPQVHSWSATYKKVADASNSTNSPVPPAHRSLASASPLASAYGFLYSLISIFPTPQTDQSSRRSSSVFREILKGL